MGIKRNVTKSDVIFLETKFETLSNIVSKTRLLPNLKLKQDVEYLLVNRQNLLKLQNIERRIIGKIIRKTTDIRRTILLQYEHSTYLKKTIQICKEKR